MEFGGTVGAMDRASARCYPAPHERPLSYNIGRDRQRRAGDRTPARTHVRARPFRAERLPASRACRSSARSVVHRPDRHAAGGLGAPIADSYRRYQGIAAGAADGRAAISRAAASAGRYWIVRSRTPRQKGIAWCCWSATRPITAASASRPIPKGRASDAGTGRLQPSPGRSSWSMARSPTSPARSARIGAWRDSFM